MSEKFDYYYGEESESCSFYRIPRLLILGTRFSGLSTDAKLLYGLMLDRMNLSARNGWYDGAGRVYIYYTLEEIQESLRCGHGKAVRLLAEMDTEKGIGLIERKKQGQGKPTRIYVKRYTTRAVPPPADFPGEEVKTSENGKSRVEKIDDFEGHPFPVQDDKDMLDLVESIKKFGVLEPVTVIRSGKDPERYEMVAGHRRKHGCALAGVAQIPAIVRDMDRDSAIIYMVDSNLKRENISPMVKARAYTMKLEAMKRKAGRPTKAQVEAGYKPMRADEQLAQQTGESRATIQRLTRLTKLEPELQDMVEEKKLPVNTAADISYLKPQEQKALADAIKREDKIPSGAKAAELKKESQAGKLTAEKIEQTVAPSKREMFLPLKVTFTEEELRPYFPKKDTTIADAKRVVFEALDLRQRALNRQKAKAEQEKTAKKAASGKER